MPSQFPRSPKLLKGALAAYQTPLIGVIPNIIIFQYNPERLRRNLAHRTPPHARTGEGSRAAAREDVLRVQGPPIETIDITITLDAADQLAEPESHPYAAAYGLQPALAALEMLLYPPSTTALDWSRLLQPNLQPVTRAEPQVPLALFIWGGTRVLPVRITRFSITEQAFDPALNPIRAQADLTMRVLTDLELARDNIGLAAYKTSQAQKELLASLNLAQTGSAISDLFTLVP